MIGLEKVNFLLHIGLEKVIFFVHIGLEKVIFFNFAAILVCKL